MSNFQAFLSFLLLVVVFIIIFYVLIKRWSKFHLSSVGTFFKILYAIILVLSILIFTLCTFNYFLDYWDNDRLKVVNELHGVSLGWSKDEVYFRKGKPEKEENNEGRVTLYYGNTILSLTRDKVERVIYFCDLDSSDYSSLEDIQCGDDVEKIITKFGKSKLVSISADKLSRIYNFPKYNLSFGLRQSRVDVLSIFDPSKNAKGLLFSDEAEGN